MTLASGVPARRIYLISSGLRAEEKAVIAAARERDANLVDVLDVDLRVGCDAQLPGAESVVLLRIPSYFRTCAVASWLHDRGHRLINSFASLARFGVKSRTDHWLRRNGIATIPSRVCFGARSAESAGRELGYPLVVKPDVGGFGRRVHLIRDERELRQASELILDLAPVHQRYVYVQKFCEVRHDLRVVVLDGEVLAVMDRIGGDPGLISRNIAQGGRGVSYRLRDREGVTVAALCGVLSTGFFGVDILITTSGEVFVCEINATCRFAEAARVTGVDIAGRVVEAAVSTHRRRQYA